MKKIQQATLLILAIITWASFSAPTASALADLEFLKLNGLNKYNPYLCEAKSVTDGSVDVGTGTERLQIWRYLRQRGLSAEQAAGVMGNMQAESGFIVTRFQRDENFNPWNNTYGPNRIGYGFGLVQWDGPRRFDPKSESGKPGDGGGVLGALYKKHPDLVKYMSNHYNYNARPAAKNEIGPENLTKILVNQMDFLYQESSKSRKIQNLSPELSADGVRVGENEWKALQKTKSVRSAAALWLINFERPANMFGKIDERTRMAQKHYDEFKDTPVSVTAGANADVNDPSLDSDGCSDPSQSSGECGTFNECVLKYAHKQPHSAPYYEMMPDYEAAVKAAQKKGLYVGGCTGGGECKPGIDCGGFVTLLIRNSGHESGYNYNGKGGNTVKQKEWLDENWTRLGNGASISSGSLKAGDVAMQPGHTFAYVGDVGEGFKSKIASASIGPGSWRTPMAGLESVTDPSITWYRKK